MERHLEWVTKYVFYENIQKSILVKVVSPLGNTYNLIIYTDTNIWNFQLSSRSLFPLQPWILDPYWTSDAVPFRTEQKSFYYDTNQAKNFIYKLYFIYVILFMILRGNGDAVSFGGQLVSAAVVTSCVPVSPQYDEEIDSYVYYYSQYRYIQIESLRSGRFGDDYVLERLADYRDALEEFRAVLDGRRGPEADAVRNAIREMEFQISIFNTYLNERQQGKRKGDIPK